MEKFLFFKTAKSSVETSWLRLVQMASIESPRMRYARKRVIKRLFVKYLFTCQMTCS